MRPSWGTGPLAFSCVSLGDALGDLASTQKWLGRRPLSRALQTFFRALLEQIAPGQKETARWGDQAVRIFMRQFWGTRWGILRPTGNGWAGARFQEHFTYFSSLAGADRPSQKRNGPVGEPGRSHFHALVWGRVGGKFESRQRVGSASSAFKCG